jgi:hypothetical protein
VLCTCNSRMAETVRTRSAGNLCADQALGSRNSCLGEGFEPEEQPCRKSGLLRQGSNDDCRSGSVSTLDAWRPWRSPRSPRALERYAEAPVVVSCDVTMLPRRTRASSKPRRILVGHYFGEMTYVCKGIVNFSREVSSTRPAAARRQGCYLSCRVSSTLLTVHKCSGVSRSFPL